MAIVRLTVPTSHVISRCGNRYILTHRCHIAAKGHGIHSKAFAFSSYLQRFIEWRDPDSNRGHHDFPLCGLRLRLLLVALQSAFPRQVAQCGVVGCSPVVMVGWYSDWCS